MTEPPSPPPRWRRRSQARPEEILEAALAEFTAKGFDAARLEDVAKRAGLSKAAIYLYFSSKEALLKALIELKVAPVARTAQTALQDGVQDPVAVIKMVAAMLAERLADPEFFAAPRLVISLAGRYPELATYYRTNVVERVRGALENLISEGIRQRRFRDVDPALPARAFIGAFLFEALWTKILLGPGQDDPRAWAHAQVDFILGGLLREGKA